MSGYPVLRTEMWPGEQTLEGELKSAREVDDTMRAMA